ncbi:unnamed protein product [Miscanthus lutarioriparius]|uniref:Secreted protein n=1 Tax=Miscanthus lutarioriparius TaxID=422564 RepID=A0A811STY9_9POAL|nr:unnamed protein product [Miscanthus lutarioriparius]
MDRAQLLLVGLPAFLFFSDLTHIFAPPPPHLRHPITTLLTTTTRIRRTIPTRLTTTRTRTRRTTTSTPTLLRQSYRSHVWMGLDSAAQWSCNSVPPARTIVTPIHCYHQ